jgi:hypothetical protein
MCKSVFHWSHASGKRTVDDEQVTLTVNILFLFLISSLDNINYEQFLFSWELDHVLAAVVHCEYKSVCVIPSLEVYDFNPKGKELEGR